MQSGLYGDLVRDGLLVRHEEVSLSRAQTSDAYKVVRPERIEFISYPYEWPFSALKQAALTTLAIQKKALERDMSLKDASAYNIQFHRGRPVLIDTLSFERYRQGEPWVAYRQFCQHFLAPLALMATVDVRLSQLLRVHVDGLPLDLASSLLPFRTRLRAGLGLHLHLHAASQRRFADRTPEQVHIRRQVSKVSLLGLIDSLESAVRGLRWAPSGTEWAGYASMTHYTNQAVEHKKALVVSYLDRVQPSMVWDLGGNIGLYSRLASDKGIFTVSFDSDPAAIEKSYLQIVERREANLLPLIVDLTNPSPALGWDLQERDSLFARGPADAIMALALVHHLALANNVPLARLANFFARLGKWLILEFVPKDDPQVQRLLAWRQDIFADYTRQGFEAAFSPFFAVREAISIRDTQRTLYLLEGTRSPV
jgi:hypothetical protein